VGAKSRTGVKKGSVTKKKLRGEGTELSGKKIQLKKQIKMLKKEEEKILSAVAFWAKKETEAFKRGRSKPTKPRKE